MTRPDNEPDTIDILGQSNRPLHGYFLHTTPEVARKRFEVRRQYGPRSYFARVNQLVTRYAMHQVEAL